MLSIAKAKQSDIPELSTFMRRSWENTYPIYCRYNAGFFECNFSPKKISSEFLEDENCFYLAKLNDEIVGYVKVNLSGPIAYLDRLYIHEKMQSYGIGRFLLLKAMIESISENITQMSLLVEENNEKAIQFYSKFNFEKNGKLIEYPTKNGPKSFGQPMICKDLRGIANDILKQSKRHNLLTFKQGENSMNPKLAEALSCQNMLLPRSFTH